MGMDSPEDGADLPGADSAPLAVGMQVRAVDSEPVFASDPSSGDLGKVMEASPPSYLVRWKSGAETWMQRGKLEPLAGADPTPFTAAARPAPAAGNVRRGRYLARYGGIILFGLLTARGWIPALRDAASHPTPRTVAVIGLVVVVLVVGIVFGTRQAAENRSAREDRKVAYAKRDAARAEARGAHDQDASEDPPDP